MKLNEREQIAGEIIEWAFKESSPQFACLTGYAGTGKTHLIKDIENKYKIQNKVLNLIGEEPYHLVCTATTHKAVAVHRSLYLNSSTIFNFLSLRVSKDSKTGKTRLVRYSSSVKRMVDTDLPILIIIDEAGMINMDLFANHLSKLKSNIKVLFVGDPYQRESVDTSAKIFDQGFPTWYLTEQLRQSTPTLKKIAKQLASKVKDPTIQITPIPEIIVCNPQEFRDELTKEFSRPDWVESDSKILSWTNVSAVRANNTISALRTGTHKLRENSWYINNRYIASTSSPLYTDELVFVSKINQNTVWAVNGEEIPGSDISIAFKGSYFVPNDFTQKQKQITKARNQYNYKAIEDIEKSWVDLREAYACTIDKAQGSTYKRVFVNLRDIMKCKNEEDRNRLIYVALTRASEKIYVYE